MQKLRICAGLVCEGCGALANGIAGMLTYSPWSSGKLLSDFICLLSKRRLLIGSCIGMDNALADSYIESLVSNAKFFLDGSGIASSERILEAADSSLEA